MNLRTRVKICGITNLEDAIAAVESGADALGFNTFEKSPRYLSPVRIREIAESLPPYVSIVGLFVNASPDFVQNACHEVPFDLLQFHGDESDDYCSQFDLPFVKAIRVQTLEQLLSEAKKFPSSIGILFDAFDQAALGGTGRSFDWAFLKKDRQVQHIKKLNIILAGGLNPENVIEAISEVAPFAVDVSSGVETSPGKKNKLAMERFISAVQSADRSRI